MQYKRPQDPGRKANATTINAMRKNRFHIALIGTLELLRRNSDIYDNTFQKFTRYLLNSLPNSFYQTHSGSGFKLQGIFKQLAGATPHRYTEAQRLLDLTQNIFCGVTQFAC